MFIIIRKAAVGESKRISDFIDKYFTPEGFGFVTDAQTKTEVMRGSVWIAIDGGKIVGVRVGIERVYNLCVHSDYRGSGIGRELIDVFPPTAIRVKSDPVGNLSKKQKENFKSPEEFYQKLGYNFSHLSRAKNFYAGEKMVDGKKKRILSKEGKKHIKVYRKPKDELPFSELLNE